MRAKHLLPIVLISTIISIVQAQDPCLKRTWKEPYKTSWLLNDGGNQAKHVMHSMDYMAVRPDGVTATVTGWDEGGSNVTVFKPDGNIQSIPTNSGTGGYGRMSMIGVALDNQYTYQLLSQHGCDGGNNSLNTNILPQYPKCGDGNTWKTVRRYNISTGGPAAFPKGYGYAGDMLVVHSGPGDLKGIALHGNDLFVADEFGDSVKVYNKSTMDSKPLRRFRFEDGIGQLSPDNQGGIWMFQPKNKTIIRFDKSTGNVMVQAISFPVEVVPASFFVDTIANRILVADNGVNQNVRIYTDIYTTPVFSSTFGKQYGIFSGIPGKYEPLKFFDIKAVGADASGNIYVANSVFGGGAVLQAYKSDGTLIWDKKGLAFTATACADPNQIEEVYTFDKKLKMDYTKTTPGSEWLFESYTLNRFKYPDDPRLHGGFYTSAWIKYINGQKFLFATDMYASQLAGFRFAPGTDGEVAIPCFFMNISGWNVNEAYPTKLGSEKDFIWMDKNGDGSMQEDEFTFKNGFDSRYSMAVWVDTDGNIWKGIREHGIRFIPLKEVNSKGVPIYDFAESKKLDIANGEIGLDGVKRLVYDREADELFISGFSNQKPDVKLDGSGTDSWWSMGSTVCMYKNVLATLIANPSANFKNVNPAWKIFIPFAASGEEGSDNTAKSFTVEGDYLFSALAKNGSINIYKRSNGEYLGQIKPGAEVNKESGWTDIDYAINVTKTLNEYLIFNEENAFGKVILYRVKSFETNDQAYADLIPSDLEILNAKNEVVANLEQNETVRFRIKVTNQGPGLVPSGKTFADGKNFKVNFAVKNLATGITKTLVSDTCTQELASGKSLKLVSFSATKPFEWMVEKGKFSITAQVNPMLGSKITECDRTNNSIVLITDSYDSLQIETQPVSKTVNVGGTTTFSVNVMGYEPISYQWYVNDVEQTSSNTNQFTLTGAEASLNNARIKVIASNSLGSLAANEAILTVLDPYGADIIGYLLKQTWYNMGGTAISELVDDSRFPDNPDSIGFINTFEVPTNVADDYGVRVSGWLIAPETGNYTFYIASDDNGVLRLSTDSLPKNLSNNPVALVPEWSDPRQFGKFQQQTSVPIYLEAGKKYYVVAMFKEEAGGDNLAVAWKLPSGVTETPIPSRSLAFYTTKTNSIDINRTANSKKVLVFPSPASDFINIKTDLNNQQMEFSISDILGRVVKTVTLNQDKNTNIRINVSELNSGIYVLTIRDNEHAVTTKFVVNH